MPDSMPVGDLAAAVTNALRGDRARLQDVVAGARERAQGRVLDALAPAADARAGAGPLPNPRPQPIPQPAADRAVVVQLPNGRRVRATISPALARRRDLAALARVTAENDRRAFAALTRQRSAIQRLDRAHDELAGKLAAIQAQADQAVISLVSGFANLERRRPRVVSPSAARPVNASSNLPRRSTPGKTAPIGPAPRMRPLQSARQLARGRDVQLLATRAQIQNVTNVVHSLQSAAYGEKGRLLATNNLLLAGNQLFWSFLDPVLQRVGVLNAASATVMAAVAPLGSLLTGEILLGPRQTTRFISGIAIFDERITVVVASLRDQVGESYWPAFRLRRDVPVTLTVLDGESSLASLFDAEVVAGDVRIRASGEFGGAPGRGPQTRVAWTVDTGAERA